MLKVGDRVRVWFAGEPAEGIVLRIDKTSRWTHVRIQLVDVEGLDEPYISSWDADSVELVAAA